MILHSNRSYMDDYYKTEQARHLNYPVNKKIPRFSHYFRTGVLTVQVQGKNSNSLKCFACSSLK